MFLIGLNFKMKWKLYQLSCLLNISFCCARLALGFYEYLLQHSIILTSYGAYVFLIVIVLKNVWGFRLSINYLDNDNLQFSVNRFFYVLFVLHALLALFQLIFLWQLFISKSSLYPTGGTLLYKIFFYANFAFIACSVYTIILDLPLVRNIKRKASRPLEFSIS